MAGPEALSVQGEGSATRADQAAAPEAIAVRASVVASVRFPQLIPIAQLIAVVLGVFAIIWNQQQSIDNLRTELTADINRVETTLTADINRVETGLDELRNELTADINGMETGLDELRNELTADINGMETRLRTELGGAIEELRTEVAHNGRRLARIEGFLGIDIAEDPPQ